MLKLRKNRIKRIVVNRHKIAANRKTKRGDWRDMAVFSIQTSGGVIAAREIRLLGKATMVYRPDKPLKCGATAWIETRDEVDYSPRWITTWDEVDNLG